jgi:drug/metabolite transporter (DMT)-like permease
MMRGSTPFWFALTSMASISMTLGNKWLMTGTLAEHKHAVLILQNATAVAIIGAGMLLGLLSIEKLTRRQMAFYMWDAFVLVIQLYSSFMSLQYLPVSATTVVRALAIPLVAVSERVVLGSKLGWHQSLCACVVVLGAMLYAHEDVRGSLTSRNAVGYLWALGNLVSFASNALLDRVMMSTSKQTPMGMAMYTQGLSLPILWAEGALFHELTLSSVHRVLLHLDHGKTTALLLTGVGAALLGSCFAQCYKIASATTVTILGNTNKIVSVLVSIAIFGNEVNRLQCIGLTASLGGAMAYSVLGAKAKEQLHDKTE